MLNNFQQQDRQPGDGQVSVQRITKGRLALSVSDREGDFSILMSDHNASRVVALLSNYLGIRLNSKDAKRIRL